MQNYWQYRNVGSYQRLATASTAVRYTVAVSRGAILVASEDHHLHALPAWLFTGRS